MIEPSDQVAIVRESRLQPLDPRQAARTHFRSIAAFEQMLQLSQQEPEKFWAQVAAELDWMKPWHTVRKGAFPHFEFFSGGVGNVCANLLDRHLRQGADNRLALIWEGENFETRFFTYRMLYHEVCKFANILKRFGLRKGDTVAIFLPNLAETIIAVLACYRLGVIFNTIFSGFSAPALRSRLESFAPRLVITADAGFRRGRPLELKVKVDEAIADLEAVETVIVVRRCKTHVNMRKGRDWWWDELMERAPRECPPESVEANEPGLVFYTSGTTGKPKGVVHSGMAFLVNNYVYSKFHLNHHPNDVLWCTADIGWATLHIWGIVGALSNGVTSVIFEGALDHPQPDRFYQVIEKYRVNKIFTAPTAVRMLMRYGQDRLRPYDLSCLEVMALVGEPLNPEAWHWINEHLGKGKIYINNTWGQTELAGCPLSGAAWLTPMKPGSCGIQYLGAKMDVVDDHGNPLPPNTVGNLIMREPIPMTIRTLWREPERYITEYFSQVPGAYFTYDAAIKDGDGHFWVVGRLDDVVNVAGHRLSTMEIESVVMECDGIAEVAVVGVPDEIKGLVPVVFATLRHGHHPSDELRLQIKRHIQERISKIAAPRSIYFTDVMPKTSAGKIMRRLLKELATTQEVEGDVSGLEDLATLERVRQVVRSE
jgi:acetyl-CoA synthetase